MLVAVYGTLKRGESNHSLLAQSSFVGCDCLIDFAVYALGPYPGIKPEPEAVVYVELFQVDQETLALLDQLEDYDPLSPDTSLYRRALIPTRFGEAYIYIYQGELSEQKRVMSGWWSLNNTPRPIIAGSQSF